MKEQKKLTIGMAIFAFTIFVCFGVIVVTEKTAPYFSSRIDKKLNSYLKENYTSIINELKIGNTNYKNTVYQLKITSLENKDLYFYLKYSNKKITDTYKEDYLEGKTLLSKISSDIEKELNTKYSKEFKVTILTTLDKSSEQIKDKFIKEENISSLPVYSLETTLKTSWSQDAIAKEIISFHSRLLQDNINPKSYNLILVDKKGENKSIKINNLTKKQIENNKTLASIINDIINSKNSNILTKNNITYEQIKE